MEKKYCIDTQENRDFLREIRERLFAFGHRFPSPGGSSWYLGDDGTPWTEKNREAYVTCRMAHVYSIASLMEHEGSEALVDAAVKGLRGELRDKEHDGWYEGLTPGGSHLSGKQCYAHAFVILAGTSAYLAGRPEAEELLQEALEVYDRYYWNEEEGLSCDNWNTEFTVMDDYRGLSKTNPKLSFAMMLAMFSLAGIPPFAGFFSKFFIFTAAINQGSIAIYVLVLIALINTIISLYYYLLVVKAMFISEDECQIANFRSSCSERLGMWIAVAGILLLGIVSCVYNNLLDMSAVSGLAAYFV